MPQKLLYSTGQVAARLGLARHQISYAFETRQIPEPRRVFGRRAYTEADFRAIREFFEERRNRRGAK